MTNRLSQTWLMCQSMDLSFYHLCMIFKKGTLLLYRIIIYSISLKKVFNDFYVMNFKNKSISIIFRESQMQSRITNMNNWGMSNENYGISKKI